MTEAKKHGFDGFLETYAGSIPDQKFIAVGMDLNQLGLDMSRPSNQPLVTEWGGPFSDRSHPPIRPDFTLPESYNVRNAPPLLSKIPSFSENTLFAVFYQYPRDVKQHAAAAQLYKRDWRWHKKLQQWMKKATEHGDPQSLPSMKEERGFYWFFDANSWQPAKKEFILNYEHLYHPPDLGQIPAQS